jgi:phosphoribosylanthranilate isomerase
MQVKICGITKPDQGRAIAQLGATALGFICYPPSPRYVTPERIREIVDQLPIHTATGQPISRIGVFVDVPLEEIAEVVEAGKLSGVQLHGSESPQFCQQLRAALPAVEIIKALRVRDRQTLEQSQLYHGSIDRLLLDAYHPALFGGTGRTLDWASLQQFRPGCPWLLSGGITPHNVQEAVSQVAPDGIDTSSGVEIAPGDKDLEKVKQLLGQLENLGKSPSLPLILGKNG